VSAPDLDIARRFLAHRPPPGALVQCAITGSHLYGFSSADSDLDIKGIHQAPTESVLGLRPVRESHDALEVFEEVECDLTTNELAAALRLLLKGNGNFLERLASPLQLVEGPDLDALRDLARGARSRVSYGHYRGYFEAMRREHLRESPGRAKSLLYSFRVALTGAHLLETGEVLAHLPTLASMYGHDDVRELIAAKAAGLERGAAPPDLAAALRGRWPALEARLQAALERSPLPQEAPNQADVEAFLVARRVAALRG
jgi:predicted nucleotidyltransferase